MHPNPVFHSATDKENLAFAAGRGFGTLAVNGTQAPMLAHVPFHITGDCAELHLMRSNPIAAAAASGPQPAVIAVAGPDSYISPDWYGTQDLVPTWNYVAVHLRGRLEMMEDSALPGVLARLSERFEAELAPKPAWHMDKLSPGVAQRMMRMIRPCRFHIEAVDGTWKLGQNKTDAARAGAADALEQVALGQNLQQLATLMRQA
ncbi:FMN-binding negative transcriptional regulator [Candidatus Halocynthiibacter alkanivorans]|uniref:FMN-binding negative transcriptional regulator n=1 Tax=Candidatus Halocynthiibacter alkanivorans TaxID=2267619 RepID=UPI000DF3EEC7|nr:FMN-binding negative transcriptional regulator [Candidatus Halocynthiibacter alkanivorans]